MATYRESLETIRNQIVAQLEEMTASPKPDYGVAGQNVSWGSHFNNLMKALADLEERLAKADHPYWRVSKARA